MNKIEIKLKKCCFDCENFDVSGIQGFQSYYACYSAGIERVIACGHYKVCKRYIEDAPLKKGKIDGVKNANHKKKVESYQKQRLHVNDAIHCLHITKKMLKHYIMINA